jgi:hypothetical protein
MLIVSLCDFSYSTLLGTALKEYVIQNERISKSGTRGKKLKLYNKTKAEVLSCTERSTTLCLLFS